jgi:hypothetical protein
MPSPKKKVVSKVEKKITQWLMWGVFDKNTLVDVQGSRRKAQKVFGPGLGYKVNKVLVKLVK